MIPNVNANSTGPDAPSGVPRFASAAAAAKATGGIPATGNSNYDDVVFPSVAAGRVPFNWWAGLFGVFWLPAKGLYRFWAMIFVPYVVATTFCNNAQLVLLNLAVGIGLFFFCGRTANRIYFEHVKNGLAPLGRGAAIGSSIGCFVAYLCMYVGAAAAWSVVMPKPIGAFAQVIAKAGAKAKQNSDSTELVAKTPSATEVKTPADAKAPAQRNVAADIAAAAEIGVTPETLNGQQYPSGAAAKLDGKKSIGHLVTIEGFYLGLMREDETNAMQINAKDGSGIWLIAFSEKFNAQVTTMKVGSPWTFKCVVVDYEDANVCVMP